MANEDWTRLVAAERAYIRGEITYADLKVVEDEYHRKHAEAIRRMVEESKHGQA